MLGTPREILGEGYPLPTDEARAQTTLVWGRAFKLHREAHDFTKGPQREGIIDPYHENDRYCDCYIRAYLELKKEWIEAIEEELALRQMLNILLEIEERVV